MKTVTGRIRKPARLAQEHSICEPVDPADAMCHVCGVFNRYDIAKNTGREWTQCIRCNMMFHVNCIFNLRVRIGKDMYGNAKYLLMCDACCKEELFFQNLTDQDDYNSWVSKIQNL